MNMWLPAILLAGSVAHAAACPDPGVTHQILVEHPTIVAFCEPCGDRVPGEPLPYTGQDVDPAYTYVQTSTARFENVAALAGCPVAGVSPSLRVEEATADGVLIVPDTRDALPSFTCREPDTSKTVKRPQLSGQIGWGAIAVGCGLTSALWIVVLRWRRRRAHRPRLG